MQWLGSLSKEEREKYLEETMALMVEGVIKPPPPSTAACLCHARRATWLWLCSPATWIQ